MSYNTGNLTDLITVNSIIDYNDIKPYANNLANYTLPLGIAYPTFGWHLWFRDGKFRAIVGSDNLDDKQLYRRVGANSYRAQQDHFVGDKEIQVGDIIKY